MSRTREERRRGSLQGQMVLASLLLIVSTLAGMFSFLANVFNPSEKAEAWIIRSTIGFLVGLLWFALVRIRQS